VSYIGFYINLDRSRERRSHMEVQLARFQVQDIYRRFAAADGNVLDLPNSRLTIGEIGCFISHYMVLRQNIGCRNHIHVIEDDTVMSDVMRFAINQLTSSDSLETYDMIFTSTGLFAKNIIECKRLFEATKIIRDSTGQVVSCNLGSIEFSSSMNSYIVNFHSLPKILGFYEDHLHKGANTPVDLFIRTMVQQGKLRATCLFPFITTDLPAIESTIADRSGSSTSRLSWDIVRRSFFINRDLKELMSETQKMVPYDEEDIFAGILSRNLHFMMSSAYDQF
jgi:GR25 family glycosyltransferase involved in LPS biosynthesis